MDDMGSDSDSDPEFPKQSLQELIPIKQNYAESFAFKTKNTVYQQKMTEQFKQWKLDCLKKDYNEF